MLTRREFLLRTSLATLIASAGIFTAVRLATADTGGPTRHALTYSGVLRDAAPGPHTLVFAFQKAGATCGPISVAATVGAGGAFSVEVPLTMCPSFFDGADVTYTVSENGTALTDAPVPITPVPYARFADQVGVNNDCPAGYVWRTDPSFTGDMRFCVRLRADGSVYDEVVRVGTGASAFWIDRYEASVWSGRQADGIPFGRGANDYPTTFPPNGRRTVPLFATSVRGQRASGSTTWFQAVVACQDAGKRLPTNAEWTLAALGTPDPATPNDGIMNDRCNTRSSAADRLTGAGAGCRSQWGSEDMIGNLQEQTAEWSVPNGNTAGPQFIWPGGDAGAGTFGGDGTWNMVGATAPANNFGLPVAVLRGGYYQVGTGAGVYAVFLIHSVAGVNPSTGFRCVVPR